MILSDLVPHRHRSRIRQAVVVVVLPRLREVMQDGKHSKIKPFLSTDNDEGIYQEEIVTSNFVCELGRTVRLPPPCPWHFKRIDTLCVNIIITCLYLFT